MAKWKNRSGEYRALGGYNAFIPKPLPPDPPLQYDDELMHWLSLANRSLGRLDGITEMLPNPDLFVLMYVRKEALLSSEIEGTQASLIELLEYEAKALEEGRLLDVQEVSNYVDAMNFGLKLCHELPVSVRLFKKIHRVLLKKGRGSERNPGELRRIQNWIGSPGCSIEDAEFVPPPPNAVSDSLSQFEKFLHDDSYLPALVKIGLAHAQFETIHPFLDGNGRMGRLLITFLLCEKQILKQPLLYLSYFFKKHRKVYYGILQRTRDAGDWEAWLKFFLRGVHETAQESVDTARRIMKVREEHRSIITAAFARNTSKALQLFERLFYSPRVSVIAVQDFLNLTFTNANNLVRDFSDLGILEEITGQKRNRVFAYQTYLDLFKDSEVSTTD